MPKAPKKIVKKVAKKNVTEVLIFITATFNNTKIVATTIHGDLLAWSTAGNCGFKGSRKSTPFAATTAAEKVVKQIIENNNAQEAGIYVKGPGPGRDAAAREVASKLKKVKFITDNTPLPHNGCRKKKRRRV